MGLSVSWTTRPRRPGEVDGVHYRFVDQAAFDFAVTRDEFVEWEQYRGYSYGTPWSEVQRALESDEQVVLEIDVRGARSIKHHYPDALSVFIEPPSVQSLEQRLRARGTDPEEDVVARLEAAREELKSRDLFDHAILNDDVERAAGELEAILDSSGPPGP